jgi:hypothetical protein
MTIPKRIFQTFEHKSFEPLFQKFVDDWKIYNNDFEYFLFDEQDRQKFIKNNFSSNVYDAYTRIMPPAFKCDLWRYCILYKYGGFYVDIDTVCLSSLDNFINADIEFVTPIDLNIGDLEYHNLSNGFIGTIPKHPILANCINRILNMVKEKYMPPENIMNFAGPGCLGMSTNEYFNRPTKSPMVDIDNKPAHLNKILQQEIFGMDNVPFAPKPLTGNYSKVSLIEFEQFTEYVKDLNGKKILQNKGGLLLLQQFYEAECKKAKTYLDWGAFGFKNVPFEKIVKP